MSHAGNDTQGRAGQDNVREEEEQREIAGQERERPGADTLGNSRRTADTSAVSGASIDHVQAARAHGGDPVDETPSMPALPPAGPLWSGPALFGDDDWLPAPPAIAPPLDLDGWLPTERASDELFHKRSRQLPPVGPPQTFSAEGVVPEGDLATEHLGAWLRALPEALPDNPLSTVLCWLSQTGAGRMYPPHAQPRRPGARHAGLGALALMTSRPEHPHATLRLALTARLDLLDHASYAAAVAGPAIHRTQVVLSTYVTELIPSDAPTGGPPELRAWWRKIVGVRAGTRWAAPVPQSTHTSALAAFLAPPSPQVSRQEGEAIATLGIGLFKEIIRGRVRVGAALAAVTRTLTQQGLPTGAAATIAGNHDRSTQAALIHLRALGRGLLREGWTPAQASRSLHQGIVIYDGALASLLDAMAAFSAPLQTFHQASPAVPALRAALDRGDLSRARGLLPPPHTIEHVLASSLLDVAITHTQTTWQTLSDLQPKLLRAGRPHLAAAVDILTCAAAWRDGELGTAQRLAQRLQPQALCHGNAPLYYEAATLELHIKHAEGATPPSLEQRLLALATAGRGLGPTSWESHLLGWVPRPS